MKIGRNDPCPCGSGKKYKKCCLTKDEAAARQAAAGRAVAQATASHFAPPAFDQLASPLTPTATLPPPAPRDPLTEARDELWEEFEAAEPEAEPSLFRDALAKPELLDAEMAFEMVCAIRDHHGREAFAEALDALEEQRPDLYQYDELYYLDWRIGDALAKSHLTALPTLCARLGTLAGNNLDVFYLALDKLEYHGQLATSARHGSGCGLRADTEKGIFSGMSIDTLPDEWPVTEFVATLREHRAELVRRYHIESLGVFGSYARNEQRVDSDLDILVSFTATPSLFTLVDLQDELSALLGVPVDLALKTSLRPRIGERILREVIEL